MSRGFERLISCDGYAAVPAHGHVRSMVQLRGVEGVRPIPLARVPKARFYPRYVTRTNKGRYEGENVNSQELWREEGTCTHAMPCTLIFGNASTNRRLSTERHRVEVNKPPDG